MPRTLSLAMLFVGFSLASGQAPPATPPPKAPKLPPSPLDKVDGYKRHLIEGFTVMISTEAMAGELKGAELAPMDVLALEFSVIKKVMPAKFIEKLHKIPVWIEWDERPAMRNGRAGSALAVYYGGTQANLLARNQNPLKAKCVTVHSLLSLTKSHQPDVENQCIVILHEYAHAIHDQQLDFEHPGIKAAYKQAMERKLYDKDQYVSTNEAEFFAETTCAYFDQLDYYPRTREELKKHDPATHKLLESLWGTAKRPSFTGLSAGKKKKLAETNGADKFDLSITIKDIRLGPVLHGPEFKPADAKGKVLVLSNFGGEELIVLEKLAKMHEELSPYGASVVVAHSYVANPATVRRKLTERNVAYTGLEYALYPDKTEGRASASPGHTLIFDPDGKCVFRGSGYDALPHARAAVARMVLAKALPQPSAPFANLVEGLTQGSYSLWESVPKIGAITLSMDADAAKAAKELAAVVTAPVQAMYAEAAGKAKADPVGAYIAAEKITLEFKGSAITAKASALMDSLRVKPDVVKELQARTLLEPVRKLDKHLASQPRGFDPGSPRFQQENADAIRQLFEHTEKLRQKYPMSHAAADAVKLALKYQRE